MAERKTLKFLPGIFQTDVNDKFLSATLDQLVSEPELVTVNGYIGRKFAPTFKNKDSYIVENSAERQNYQLEPSVVVRDDQGKITFFSSYIDLLNKIEYYGGLVDNHDRLFSNEFYSFDPRISYDKIVNFSQYYWLPDGPNSVSVNTSGVELTQTFTVTRDVANNRYVFSDGDGATLDNLTLARGGVYQFVVNQPGVPFWIQVEPGVDGLINATPTISNREVMGVENNGEDVGTITFSVPQSDAQQRFIEMPVVFNVDYATPFNSLPYSNLHNKLRSQFLEAYPQYAGITGQLDGKHLVFIDQTLAVNVGDEAWTAQDVYDNDGNLITGWGAGDIVPDNQRSGVWKVILIDIGFDNDPLIRLVPVQDVAVNEKVYVKYGLVNANREFYKDFDGFFYRVPVISTVQDVLYFQDSQSAGIFGEFKIVEYANWSIDVNQDILGKEFYTSPNGVRFTSGLKITFDEDVVPESYQNNTYYVENIGDSIRLVDVTLMVTPEPYNDELALNYPDQSFPDYVTINRSHPSLSAWSRNNRWFHRDVIIATAEYNNTIPVFDQALRAQRPIIQFEGDLQLFNDGRIGKRQIDILDTTTLDAFNDLEGEILDTAFGIPLRDGLRVLFAADNDPLVRDKIYVVNLVQYELDSQQLPTGPVRIKLTLAEDGDNSALDSVVVMEGQYKGSQWWYDGSKWNESQQKTALNQEPLFDVFDTNGQSLNTYNRSTFKGTRVFGYKRKSTLTFDGKNVAYINEPGTPDTVLGFTLSYRNFGTQGDIEFDNYFDNETFSYVIDQEVITPNISTGFLYSIVDRDTVNLRNVWRTVVEESKQYQIITRTYTGSDRVSIDILPKASSSIPYTKVYVNNRLYKTWTIDSTTKELVLDDTNNLVNGDKIDILIYSDSISSSGFYQIPLNLDLNAQNINLSSLTLGQVRNHLVEMSQNSTQLEGEVLAASNLRDIEIKQQGGNILKHSAPATYASLFLLDETANFVDSVRFAQREYSKFKNKFLELSSTLSGIDPQNPVTSVDLILTEINKIKNSSFPWFYSDMVPYGPLKTTVADGYIVFDPTVRSYEITNVFSSTTLSNQAVLVYLNGVQLLLDIDYFFETDRPAVSIRDTVTLEIDDIISIVEYSNTDGNYIPETPTKLGLFPKYAPQIFLDDTYRTATNVIRGHDGSLTPAFNDYRDNFLLELEKRIFNNIKAASATFNEIYSAVPGKFRKTEYTLSDMNRLLSKGFLGWIGNNKLDYSTNSTFQSNDLFTWNYSNFLDRIDGENLPGSWRACFRYFYDTDAPHQRPWEMLGFTIKPDWWEEYYGQAPYTGGNKLLWEDLEAGRIVGGPRSLIDFGFGPGIDPNFRRPGLSQVIPVDENGILLSPAAMMTRGFNAARASSSWSIGQWGPVETAWRRSSDFPYAIQIALALAKPAKYFGLNIDTYNYRKNRNVGQILTAANRSLQQNDATFNGDRSTGVTVRASGYLNWIADYLVNRGINPSSKITTMLKNYTVNLAYKTAGFTDQSYVQVLAEQSSPTSTNDSIVIPSENYKVHLYKSTPVDRITLSAVLIEKTNSGYSVKGYDLNNPYFTIIPSIVNSNATRIRVLNAEAIAYNNYQLLKLTVPYGYEFKSRQQVADFLISYERYLIAQGFNFSDFDEELAEMRDWKLSVKEFLFWSQQGWKPGSIIALNPVANVARVTSSGAIVDTVYDDQYGTKVIDQNFKLVKNNNYEVMRTPTNFKMELTNDQIIGLLELNLVQFEHVLVFDNATVFNDIIYKPELGNRQYRLKLIGQKTGSWNGSLYAPGFIYNSGEVDAWQPGQDYLKGDLVEFKQQFYVAINNVVANDQFDFSQWTLADYGQVSKGLLTNFSSIAVKGQSYYDPYGYFNDADQIKYSHGLIGFKPRGFLDDLAINETSQIEFYKGYIKQKGSANAFDALTRAEFNNLASDINYFEEWAVRIGEYGAIDTNPYVEIALDEKAYSVNPALVEFVGSDRNSEGNGVDVFNASQLYKLTDQYSGTIALNRDDASEYALDILTAGYVNIDDVDTTIFDLAEFNTLNADLDTIGNGYSIWTAKDFTGDWNVYRVTETDNDVITVTNALNGFITFTTRLPHELDQFDVFMVRNFDGAFDGFYQVTEVVDLNNVTVTYSGDTTELSVQQGFGRLFRLDSLRFKYMENAREYTPPHGWKPGEKIWIDIDAATSAVQGQPYETDNNLWKVYEKYMPWNVKQSLDKQPEEYVADDGFGVDAKLSLDGTISVVSSPFSGNGSVNVFAKDKFSSFSQSAVITPKATGTSEFGTSINLSVDRLAVGAPGSNSDNGYVYVYKKFENIPNYAVGQIISGNLSASGERFGHSVVLDEFGEWLYVGAPAADRVYVYGLNKFVEEAIQITSVNNLNTITLNGNIAVTAGSDYIYQPATGAYVQVLTTSASTNVVVVSSLTNIDAVFSSNIEVVRTNLYGDAIGTSLYPGVYPTAVSSTATITSIQITDFTVDTDFIPLSGGYLDPDAFLVATRDRTYIPGYDYVVVSNLSGVFVDFITAGNVSLPSPVAQNDVEIKQGPYYTLTRTIEGPAGSEFGYVVDSSYDGAQLAVGAPNDTVNVAVFSDGVSRSVAVGTATAGVVSYHEYSGAGSVFVYDRVIEAFNSTGTQDYQTQGTLGEVYKVTVDEVEVNRDDYQKIGNDTIRFVTPPDVGKVVFVETNEFNLLEKLIGIDSLEGGLTAIQQGARFGTDLTICSNNCAIYVGAPRYDNKTTYNTGAVWKFHNKGRLYGTNYGYKVDPEFTPNDTIRLDNFEVRVNLGLSGNVTVSAGDYITQPSSGANVAVVESTTGNYIKISDYVNSNVFVMGTGNIHINGVNAGVTPRLSSLDEFVGDINDADLLGISAVNEANRLRINSDRTVAKNLLRILSGRNLSANPLGVSNVYSAAEMAVFAFMQIIINPYNSTNEFFGNKVILARNAYMLVIGSERGTTKKYTTFDQDTTTLDSESTAFFDSINGSGSVYIYELYDDPRPVVEHPGRYAFAQQLNPGDLNPGDRFGAAVDIVGDTIIVSSPGDDTTLTNAGSVYIFENPKRTRGWNLIRYQEPKVDIDSVGRIFLYNKNTNTILTNLEFIDPAKGKIPGLAEQEINYKTAYDPAKYNVGTNSRATVDADLYWGVAQVGQVWWDLDRVRFIDYEQDSLTYRSINWGRLFPGSTVDILEWTASDVLPSQYVERYPGNGVPKYADDSAYVEILFVDGLTNAITSKYYFWVGDKPQLDPTLVSRRLPVASIKSIIENPKAQGLAYAAIIQNNALITYNVSQYLSASDTILHLSYEIVKNNSLIHSEYELIQKGNPLSFVPEKISNKLVDSLSGIDAIGRIVPDPKLSTADRLGIGFRPRQSMFVNRQAALLDFVGYVNGILIKQPVARQYDLTRLLAEEPQPNIKLGEYNQSIQTEEALSYIDTTELPVGYKVLVETDTTQDNLWVLYRLDQDKTWVVDRVQSYKTSLYWEYVDWYAEGYSATTQIDFAVPTLIDALKLQAVPGSEILVRVATGALGFGGWNILVINDRGGYDVVGIQDGTIQLKESLGNFEDFELGFGNQGYDIDRLDQNPNIEIRFILQALKEDIFINELGDQYNKLFFVMINYLFGEQKYVDWIFKTSFISVTHSLRELNQFPNYIKDNQTYYQEYINEVKPYSTKIREYLIRYNSLDEFAGDITDFDLPPYYDTDSKIFRSPSGERGFVAKDQQLWQTGPYTQWYQNRNHQIDSILVVDGGSGYTSIPEVIITGGGQGAIQATARATIDFDTGEVIGIVVTNSGSGYFETPTVTINGSNTTPARAYAVLKGNQVRSLNTTIKFDRTTYTSSVLDWMPNTSYVEGDIISYEGVGYLVTANVTTGNSFISSDYTIVDPASFDNASDRIMAYYAPGVNMPARDLKQLLAGIEYPGVQIQGLDFNKQPGFDNGTLFDDLIFDPIAYDEDGNPTLSDSTVDTTISSSFLDTSLGLRPEDIDIDGGGYVDTYSSHAPEELIPGIVYEALDMKVYTQITANNAILGHRVFSRSYSIVDPTNADQTVIVTDTEYSRIADRYSTLLAEDLNITDTEIVVVDATKCPMPSPTTPIPGVIFINGERIIYWTINYATNTLGQIRRGTLSTATPMVHPAGMLVVDGSLDQEVPGIVTGATTGSNTAVASTSLSYKLKLTGNVSANVGDVITQATNSANLMVIGRDRTNVDTIWINYMSGGIDYARVELEFSSNLTIYAGDVVSQPSSNASLTVSTTVYDVANVELVYNTLESLDSQGNLWINGVDSGLTVANIAFNPDVAGNLAINGTYTGDIYPVVIEQLGYVNGLSVAGEYTIDAGNTYVQSWYNVGFGSATDSTGFEGSTTEPVLFLKDYPASYTVGIAAEDTVNILSILITTEDDELIIEE